MNDRTLDDPSAPPIDTEPSLASEFIDETWVMLDLVLEDPYRPCGVGDDLDLL